jgi:predicted Ser/Thr protein kinase
MSGTVPERIGRYEVLGELGQGAMGVVYKARDPQLERTVAIKTLRRDLGLPPEEYADLRKRFAQEATAAGRLNHPHIVTIHDVIDIGDVPYIVMEFLQGQSLGELIGGVPLPPARAVPLVVQVCEALDYAHAHGVVHRDIKPGNIMVLAGDVAKVSDFGIARIAGSAVTRTGVVVGTPAYMAPEQLRGRVPDGRSDLFSLGVVLYEALAGRNPFQCEELTATLYQVVQVDPPPLSEKNSAISAALARVTTRVLAKEPEQRYPTARALAEALTGALAAATAPATVVTTLPTRRPAYRRRRRAAAVVSAVAVLLATVGGVALWRREPTPEPAAPPPVVGTRRPAARVGEVVVSTNPAVEVLLDGTSRGLTGDGPLVIRDVAAGDRLVTLRLGSRTQELSGTVREGQTLWLAYRFTEASPPPAAPREVPLGKALEAEGQRLLGTAREKLREALPEQLRDLTGQKPPASSRSSTPAQGR